LKKILIFGPIGDFGGREVEVNIMCLALENYYNVKVFSTGSISNHSFALRNTKGTYYSSLNKALYNKYLIIKLLSYISFFKNYCKNKPYHYASNFLVKKFFDLKDKRLKIIHNEISNANLVLLPVQLTSGFLEETISFCKENKIPCLLRTTGTIFNVNESAKSFLKDVTLFVHHSNKNANSLSKFLKHKYTIIDQCSITESELLSIKFSNNKPLIYGFIGRLSEEKKILQVSDFFANSRHDFYIAGEGPLKKILLKTIEKSEQCKYLGYIPVEKIHAFFSKIDVLIIASSEESGPLVGIEAMAAGKMIISTDVGAMKERLENSDKSFWFKWNDLNTLKKAINQLESYSSEELSIISNDMRSLYNNNYSFDFIKKKYLYLVNDYV
jgi:glycosyltransferase involved in cell wall biosynthesis